MNIKTTAYLFALLGLIFIPFPFHLFPYQLPVSEFLFGGLVEFITEKICRVHLINSEISSDSGSMLILISILFGISLTLSFFLKPNNKLYSLIRLIVSYYLALILLKYGLDKVFKAQFYLPEPNILYTPLGQVNRDLLFWSSMGTSYFYNVFGGAVEVIAALMLLFKKTRVVGLLINLGVMLNILAINIGFDIDVKLFSSFLLFLTLLLLYPHFSALYIFFIQKKNTTLKEADNPTFALLQHAFFRPFLKTFLILMFLLEGLYPYLKYNNFNDDLQPRPYLHGAYQVLGATDKRDSAEVKKLPFKRIFVHRHGYLIFQNENDETQDFKLEIDTLSHTFSLTDYNLKTTHLSYLYNENDSLLTLDFQHYRLTAKALNWRKMKVFER